AANAGEGLSEGILLIHNKLKGILEQKGLKAMESTGEAFDPEFHEALTEIPVPAEDMKGKIVDTIEQGYTLNDKIIRHAKVVVGK
ncbi:MAG: nucleotide exchange factor GrpE, partial [Lewinella sp.]|nr:nucleotide exchange factor GrpE [Lewinella sp.]